MFKEDEMTISLVRKSLEGLVSAKAAVDQYPTKLRSEPSSLELAYLESHLKLFKSSFEQWLGIENCFTDSATPADKQMFLRPVMSNMTLVKFYDIDYCEIHSFLYPSEGTDQLDIGGCMSKLVSQQEKELVRYASCTNQKTSIVYAVDFVDQPIV
jgi:hypothetical protein